MISHNSHRSSATTKMKRCLAFSALVGSRDAWRPCSRRAVPGSAFCGRHTEVMAGVMLGLCVNGFLDGGPDAPRVTGRQNSPATPGTAARTKRTAGAELNAPRGIEH